MTGDGRVDLIACGGTTSVFVLPNIGDRRFLSPVETPLLSVSSWMEIADMNGDGSPDIVTSDRGEGFLTVLRNESNPPSSQDLDLDGIPDECGRRLFRRGDVNVDVSVDIADPVCLLVRLFGGQVDFCGRHEVACLEAADANNDGAIDLSDAVHLLGSLFLDVGPLPPPADACGEDPDPRGTEADLGCREYDPCA